MPAGEFRHCTLCPLPHSILGRLPNHVTLLSRASVSGPDVQAGDKAGVPRHAAFAIVCPFVQPQDAMQTGCMAGGLPATRALRGHPYVDTTPSYLAKADVPCHAERRAELVGQAAELLKLLWAQWAAPRSAVQPKLKHSGCPTRSVSASGPDREQSPGQASDRRGTAPRFHPHCPHSEGHAVTDLGRQPSSPICNRRIGALVLLTCFV